MFTPHFCFRPIDAMCVYAVSAAQCPSSCIYLFDEDLGLKSYLLFSHFSSIGRRPTRVIRRSYVKRQCNRSTERPSRRKENRRKHTNKQTTYGLSKYENYSVSFFFPSSSVSFLLTENVRPCGCECVRKNQFATKRFVYAFCAHGMWKERKYESILLWRIKNRLLVKYVGSVRWNYILSACVSHV